MSKLAILMLSVTSFLNLESILAETSSPQLYFYKLNVQNASEWQNGYLEPDLVSSRAAAALNETQPEACIDLRKLILLNYRSETGIMVNGDIGLLMNTKIIEAAKSAITARICQNAPGPGVCSVRFTEEKYDVSDLAILNQPPIVENNFQPRPTIHTLNGKRMLPKFSSACETGQFEDSWEFAASTSEARSYLSEAGVVIRPKGVISLGKPDGTKIFDFGHPRAK